MNDLQMNQNDGHGGGQPPTKFLQRVRPRHVPKSAKLFFLRRAE